MNKRKWGYKMRYNYRGFFDVLTDYAKYDAVEFDTKVWWCKRPTKGRSPADRAMSAVWVPVQEPIATALKSSGGDPPFGTEVTCTEILPQETVTVAAVEGSSALSANLTGLVPIEIGKKYRVTFDGVAYVCVAYKHASWGAICLGNGRLNGGSTEKTDEPFCINVWASTAASISLVTEGTHTVSVDEIVETHTPIQQEYLTGEKPQPYMHLVTDGDGKAGWEQRLGYKAVEETELVPQTEIEPTEENPYVRIDSTVVFAANGTYEVTWDGTVYKCATVETETDVFAVGNAVLVGGQGGNGEPFMISGTGSKLIIVSQTMGAHTFSISQLAETLHPIPAEYLPEIPKVITLDERARKVNVASMEDFKAAFEAGATVRWVTTDGYYLYARTVLPGDDVIALWFYNNEIDWVVQENVIAIVDGTFELGGRETPSE